MPFSTVAMKFSLLPTFDHGAERASFSGDGASGAAPSFSLPSLCTTAVVLSTVRAMSSMTDESRFDSTIASLVVFWPDCCVRSRIIFSATFCRKPRIIRFTSFDDIFLSSVEPHRFSSLRSLSI